MITLFNILRFPFAFLPLAIVQWITTAIALGRVQNFLLLEELDVLACRGTSADMKESTKGQNSIEIQGPVSFAWERSSVASFTPTNPIDVTTGNKKTRKQISQENEELQATAQQEMDDLPWVEFLPGGLLCACLFRVTVVQSDNFLLSFFFLSSFFLLSSSFLSSFWGGQTTTTIVAERCFGDQEG